MSKSAKRKRKSQASISIADMRPSKLDSFVRRHLMAFIIGEGVKALDRVLEEDRVALCGPAYSKGAEGDPVRWGYTEGRLTFGGQRAVFRKPRVRQGEEEVELPTWEDFSDEDPLDDRALEQLILGVSTRRYSRSLETLPPELDPHGTSKSAVSRRFVAMTRAQLDAWLEKDLSDLPLVAIMLDGIVVAKHTVVVALGIDETGIKHPLGLYLGDTENAVICGELLDNLIGRGIDPLSRYLFVIDGSKALRKAIRTRFGTHAMVQRCQTHKRRNILSHLPKELHVSVGKSLSDAYKAPSKKAARTRLEKLAKQLMDDHPDAAASIMEGLEETLTVKGMELPKALERLLSTTNAIENLNGSIRRVSMRVKRWRDGAMIKRWVAAGILEAQGGFRRVKGHKGLPLLREALNKTAPLNETLDAQQIAA